jgi:hypothetical protein
MTEELLVYALGESERKRRENQEKVRRLTIALDETAEALRAATARAERANIIVEALAESARIHCDGGGRHRRGGDCSAMDFICDPWGYYGREVHLLY